jgi:hypothetical protein
VPCSSFYYESIANSNPFCFASQCMNTFSQGQTIECCAVGSIPCQWSSVGPGCSVNTDCPASSDPARCPIVWTARGITDAPSGSCNDGDSCTSPDACLNGSCVAGPQTVAALGALWFQQRRSVAATATAVPIALVAARETRNASARSISYGIRPCDWGGYRCERLTIQCYLQNEDMG